MKIQITKPTAITMTEDGSTTERFGIGENVESSEAWMVKRLKSLIDSGFAVEVGGNAEPTETKAPKKRVRKKATS